MDRVAELLNTASKLGVTVRLHGADKIEALVPRRADAEAVAKEIFKHKPRVLETLRRQEFNRLYALVRASMSRVTEIYPEGGIAEAKRQGMWPKILGLEHSIDQALVDLDKARLLGALEALERAWQEVTDKTAQRRRQNPPRLEATA